MAEFKVAIGVPKEKKTLQVTIGEDKSGVFMDKKIGDKINGNDIGYSGYEFEITGGSDKSGFPMRKDNDGALKKRILTTKGVGVKDIRKGEKIRKTVAGNTISELTSQINLKVTKDGKESLFAEEKTEEANPEEKAAE